MLRHLGALGLKNIKVYLAPKLLFHEKGGSTCEPLEMRIGNSHHYRLLGESD
jgi:hypothetical protein